MVEEDPSVIIVSNESPRKRSRVGTPGSVTKGKSKAKEMKEKLESEAAAIINELRSLPTAGLLDASDHSPPLLGFGNYSQSLDLINVDNSFDTKVKQKRSPYKKRGTSGRTDESPQHFSSMESMVARGEAKTPVHSGSASLTALWSAAPLQASKEVSFTKSTKRHYDSNSAPHPTWDGKSSQRRKSGDIPTFSPPASPMNQSNKYGISSLDSVMRLSPVNEINESLDFESAVKEEVVDHTEEDSGTTTESDGDDTSPEILKARSVSPSEETNVLYAPEQLISTSSDNNCVSSY